MDVNKYLTLTYTQISSKSDREIALNESAGVYAWYRGFSMLFDIDSPDVYLEKIQTLLSSNLSERFTGKLGYLYKVSIQETSGPLSEKKSGLLGEILKSQDLRDRLTSILNDSIDLQSPLYVGKAANLRKRIGEHVSGSSGLRERFEDSKIVMGECILRYKYIDDQIVSSFPDQEEEVVILIEDILTRLSPAAFVRRPG